MLVWRWPWLAGAVLGRLCSSPGLPAGLAVRGGVCIPGLGAMRSCNAIDKTVGILQIGFRPIPRSGLNPEGGRDPMRLTGFLMAFVCAASLLIVGQDDSASDVQSRIVALEKAWNQAYKLGDRKALDALLDDHIVLVNDDGSMQTKGEFLASINKSDSQEQQVTPESITVHVYGN